MPTLLFATTNAHKTEEVRQILGPQWQIQNLRDHPKLPVPDETGDTFEANAIIKAASASAALPGLAAPPGNPGPACWCWPTTPAWRWTRSTASRE